MKYALLDENEKRAIKCANAITMALNACAIKIRNLANKYPEAGLGDTATDEEIASEFYGMIHCGNSPDILTPSQFKIRYK